MIPLYDANWRKWFRHLWFGSLESHLHLSLAKCCFLHLCCSSRDKLVGYCRGIDHQSWYDLQATWPCWLENPDLLIYVGYSACARELLMTPTCREDMAPPSTSILFQPSSSSSFYFLRNYILCFNMPTSFSNCSRYTSNLSSTSPCQLSNKPHESIFKLILPVPISSTSRQLINQVRTFSINSSGMLYYKHIQVGIAKSLKH